MPEYGPPGADWVSSTCAGATLSVPGDGVGDGLADAESGGYCRRGVADRAAVALRAEVGRLHDRDAGLARRDSDRLRDQRRCRRAEWRW